MSEMQDGISKIYLNSEDGKPSLDQLSPYHQMLLQHWQKQQDHYIEDNLVTNKKFRHLSVLLEKSIVHERKYRKKFIIK